MRYFDRKWPGLMLWPLSVVYRFIIAVRNELYNRKVFPSQKVSCFVISIGNITVGGTGKTPTTIFLAKWLQGRNLRVCVLSRGYGRQSRGTVMVSDGQNIRDDVKQVGDEPLMMARRLPGIAVIVDRDRIRGAKHAIEVFSPQVILLDDGFQHRRLERDLDIVTIHMDKVFSNGMMLPAGPLREPIKSLQRANLLWLNHMEDTVTEVFPYSETPFINAYFCPISLVDGAGHETVPQLNGVAIVAFCGLGNPDNFKKTLGTLGANIRAFMTFDDHHDYTSQDFSFIENTCQIMSASLVITTEKDWVKLPKTIQQQGHWRFLGVELVCNDLSLLENRFAAKFVSI